MEIKEKEAQYNVVDPQMVTAVASALLRVLSLESCLIPNSVRRDVENGEELLKALAAGAAMVVAKQRTKAPEPEALPPE